MNRSDLLQQTKWMTDIDQEWLHDFAIIKDWTDSLACFSHLEILIGKDSLWLTDGAGNAVRIPEEEWEEILESVSEAMAEEVDQIQKRISEEDRELLKKLEDGSVGENYSGGYR